MKQTNKKDKNTFERQGKSRVLFRHVNLECLLHIEVAVSGGHLDKYICRNIIIKESCFISLLLGFFFSFGVKPAFEHFLLAFNIIFENDSFNYVQLSIDMVLTRQG